MSGVMGSTVVNLGLNNDRFKKGLTESQSGLKSFAGSAASLINPVTAGFAAITAGAVGTGLAIWGMTERIGKLAGVADKAAQTGLSGKFLQQLEFAADQSGVSAEALTGGIKKLTILIGNAADGSKEAAASLAQFGLNADELKSLSPEAQFMRIAEKISQIPTAAGRAAAAVKLFGKSGIDMTTLFAGGLNDIKKLMQDAADIGIGLDDNALAKAAAADDAIQKMKASFGAMLDQVAVGVAPAFEQFSTYITGLNGPMTKVLDKFNEMPDRLDFIADLLEASMDVAFLSIAANWDKMLADMYKNTVAKFTDMSRLNPFQVNPNDGMNLKDRIKQAGGNPDLGRANKRLEELMGQLQGPAAAAAPAEQAKPRFEGNTPAINNLNAVYAEWDRLGMEANKARDAFLNAAPGPDQIAAMKVSEDAQAALSKMAQETVKEAHAEVRKETGGKKLTEGVSSLWESLQSPIAEAQMAAQGMWDRGKIKADAAMGTLSNIFGGEPAKKEKPIEPRLAGAMQAGSQDAYSTIVQAMIRQADPVIKATEKQTREFVKAIKKIPATRLAYVAAFEGVNGA